MTRLFRFGVLTTLWLPLAVSAGASLEDIESNTEKEVIEVSEVTEVIEEVNAVDTNTPQLFGAGSAGGDSNIRVVAAPPVYQFYSSDKAAELQYERNGSVFGLNNQRAIVSFLLNEERDNAITAAVMFDAGTSIAKGLKLSFGPKLIAGLLSIENADVIGFAANVEALYVLPMNRFPMRLSTGFSYAPDILTFGQSDRIIDWNVRAGLPLTSNIDGFIGARYLQFDTRPGERKLDQQVHVGIRWTGKSK